MTEQYFTEQQYEDSEQEELMGNSYMMHMQPPSQYFSQFQNFAGMRETSQFDVMQPNVEQVMETSQLQEMDEQHVEVESLKMKHKDAADLLRDEAKQMIFLQVTRKTTVNILDDQKNDVNQDISEVEKEIETATTENQISAQQVAASNEEILQCKTKIQNLTLISSQLAEFCKNLKANYEQVKSICPSNQNILNIITDWEELCSKDSRIKSQMKKANECLDKPDKGFKQRNALLKQENVEKTAFFNSLLAKKKKLDENIDKMANKNLKVETEISEHQQIKNGKDETLKNLLLKIRQLEEKKKVHEANLKVGEESKLKRCKELQLRHDEIKKNITEKKQENETSTTTLKNLKEQVANVQVSLSEKMENLEHSMRNLEEATVNHSKADNSDELLKTEAEKIHLNAEIQQLEKSKEITKYQNAKEKSDFIIKKCEAEKLFQIEAVLKERLEEKVQKLENAKQNLEKLSEKIDSSMDNKTLRNLIEQNADMKASLEYLNDKGSKITEQIEMFKSDIEKLKLENEDVTDTIHKLEKEFASFKSLKSGKNVFRRTTQQLSSILKMPKPKTPPLSPKKVTFDLTDSESIKSSVEVGKTDKSGSLQKQTPSSKSNETQGLKGLLASLLESSQQHQANPKSSLNIPKKRRITE